MEDEHLEINKKEILNGHTHHTIRLNNILRVVLNEILVNEKVVEIVKKLVHYPKKDLNAKILRYLKNNERKDFNNSYHKYFHYEGLKPMDIGEVKYYESMNSSSCVILLHGFSSAPKEMEELAIKFHQSGLNVYTPRLDGHGTVAEDLKTKEWNDWYKSLCKAITIASLEYKNLDPTYSRIRKRNTKLCNTKKV